MLQKSSESDIGAAFFESIAVQQIAACKSLANPTLQVLTANIASGNAIGLVNQLAQEGFLASGLVMITVVPTVIIRAVFPA